MIIHGCKSVWVLLVVVGLLWAHGGALADSAPSASAQDTGVGERGQAHPMPTEAPKSRQSDLILTQRGSRTACECPVKQCPNENAPACQARCEEPQTATCTCRATCDPDSGYVKGVNSCTCQ
jgi:hypothetical protein